MISLKIAAATHCFSQPLKPSLVTATEIGVRAVQLDSRSEVPPDELSDTGRRQFRHYLEEISLELASLKFPARRTFYDQEYLEPRITALKAAMKLAWDLKTRVVCCRIGKLPEELESPEMYLLREVVNDLAAYSNQTGVVLAITPTNDSPAALKAFLGSINQGPIGVNFDPAVFVMARQNPIEAYRVLHEYVLHLQARDGVREVDGGLEVPIGRGEVDWDELLVLLEDADYAGWMTLERTTGDYKLGDMTRAVAYLRRVAMG